MKHKPLMKLVRKDGWEKVMVTPPRLDAPYIEIQEPYEIGPILPLEVSKAPITKRKIFVRRESTVNDFDYWFEE